MTKTLRAVSRHFHGPSWLAGFVGNAPGWYKTLLLAWLLLNPVLLEMAGPFITSWVVVIEFIVTLVLTRYGFPFVTGGLLLVQVWALGLVSTHGIDHEIVTNYHVLFLVLFVVTAVQFVRELLAYVFIKAILFLKNELGLALFFLLVSAVLSAVLDALTVMAVVSTVLASLYAIYHRVASEVGQHQDHDHTNDGTVHEHKRGELEAFRSALRRLVMLSAIGTMLGGIMTLIGEPQNIVIGKMLGWDFGQFFMVMLPVSLPVLLSGAFTGIAVEKILVRRRGWFDFGQPLPAEVRWVIREEAERIESDRTVRDFSRLGVQAIGFILLVSLLIFRVEVYLAGLITLVFLTAFLGSTEHQIGRALEEGGPFVMVLAVFFGIVAMIHEQHLFVPVTNWVMGFEGSDRLLTFFGATGALSAISDNVFVATLYIGEAEAMHTAGVLTREEYEMVAVAINMGTNVPSILTPNGQAAFLYLLMSPLAPLIKLTYGRMLAMAVPFTIVTTATAVASIVLFF